MSQPETSCKHASVPNNTETRHDRRFEGYIFCCRRAERALIVMMAASGVWAYIAWSLGWLPRDYSPFDAFLAQFNLRLSTEWAEFLSWMSTAVLVSIALVLIVDILHGWLQRRRFDAGYRRAKRCIQHLRKKHAFVGVNQSATNSNGLYVQVSRYKHDAKQRQHMLSLTIRREATDSSCALRIECSRSTEGHAHVGGRGALECFIKADAKAVVELIDQITSR